MKEKVTENREINLDESKETGAENLEINLDEQVQLYWSRISSLLKWMAQKEIEEFSNRLNDLLKNEELSINISNLRKKLEESLWKKLANEIIKRIEDSWIDIDWLINNVKFTDKGMEIWCYLIPYELETNEFANIRADGFENNRYNIHNIGYFNEKWIIEHLQIASKLNEITNWDMTDENNNFKEYIDSGNLHEILGKHNYRLPNYGKLLSYLPNEKNDIVKILNFILPGKHWYLINQINKIQKRDEEWAFRWNDWIIYIWNNSFTVIKHWGERKTVNDYYPLLLVKEIYNKELIKEFAKNSLGRKRSKELGKKKINK